MRGPLTVRRRIHRQRGNKPMPVATPPPYPKSLTTASWDKAKGLIARISKVKTGVTEELQKAEKAFKAAPFAELNVSPLVLNKSLDLKGLKQVQDDYLRKYQPKFKALELVFYDLSQTFKKKAAEFEADPKLKQFAPALKTMSADANKFTYAVAWGTVSTPNQKYLQDMITSQEKSEKQWASAKADLKKLIDKAASEVTKAISAKLSAKDYVARFWSENLRGIGAQIAMASRSDPGVKVAFDAPFRQAAKLWAQNSLPSKDDQVPEQLKKDQVLIRQFKVISDRM
jgi:hypothetical protein